MGVISTSQPPTGDGNTGYRRQAEFLSGERKKYVRTLLPPARLNFLRREGTPSPDVRGSLPFLKGGLRITPPLFRTFLPLSSHSSRIRSNNNFKVQQLPQERGGRRKLAFSRTPTEKRVYIHQIPFLRAWSFNVRGDVILGAAPPGSAAQKEYDEKIKQVSRLCTTILLQRTDVPTPCPNRPPLSSW